MRTGTEDLGQLGRTVVVRPAGDHAALPPAPQVPADLRRGDLSAIRRAAAPRAPHAALVGAMTSRALDLPLGGSAKLAATYDREDKMEQAESASPQPAAVPLRRLAPELQS